MKRAKSLHEFGMWWLMRFGTGEVPYIYGSEIAQEIWDMVPSKTNTLQELPWNGWLLERQVTYYTLSPKALAHVAKYNKGHTK